MRAFIFALFVTCSVCVAHASSPPARPAQPAQVKRPDANAPTVPCVRLPNGQVKCGPCS